jgi:hypothetical protein
MFYTQNGVEFEKHLDKKLMNVNVLRFQSNMHVHSLKCHQFEEISKKIDDH